MMRKLRVMVKIVWHTMAVVGIISLVGGGYGAYRIARDHSLTPRELVLKVTGKLGLEGSWVEEAATAPARYADREFEGTVRKDHPRVYIRGERHLAALRQRYQGEEHYRKRVDRLGSSRGLMANAVAWTCGEELEAGKNVIEALVRVEVRSPRVTGDYGNGMEIALAYDLVADHPGWTSGRRQRVVLKLRRNLKELLILLDSESPSLWHGRFQLACAAWVVTASLDQVGSGGLRSRAQGHFFEALQALELSGGWPEGYNYWINNRAFPFVTACLAHMNAVEAAGVNERIRGLLRQVGLWTIYGTEPQGRFHLFGDSGPRNDLKDETQRVVDLISLGTGFPSFRDYSRYIQGLHGGAGYYRAYRWGIPLFRGLPAWDFRDEDALSDLSVFEDRFEKSALFGRHGMGQVFMRSGWGPDATFISYQAGPTFTHHGHYQAGYFTVTKGAPLAITSGTYGGYTSPHRLNYYLRTVAANSLLVLRPGERVRPNKFFERNVAAGGQRVVMPTGSAVQSVEDWKENLGGGGHYEGGRITAFENAEPGFVYVGSDLTGAYNNTAYDETGGDGKVSRVTRQVVYLYDEDRMIVHDRVAAVDPSYTKKWLLHSWSKPTTETERVLQGTAVNGILESTDHEAAIQHNGGRLGVTVLLPETGVIRKVGGADYRYYVEMDGDDSDLDGENMVEGASEKPWFDAGLWRMEIQPAAGQKKDSFLVVLEPGLKGLEARGGKRKEADQPALIRDRDGSMQGVATDTSVVLFGIEGTVKKDLRYEAPSSKTDTLHVLVDLTPGRELDVSVDGEVQRMTTSAEGVASFRVGPGSARQIRVRLQ